MEKQSVTKYKDSTKKKKKRFLGFLKFPKTSQTSKVPQARSGDRRFSTTVELPVEKKQEEEENEDRPTRLCQSVPLIQPVEVGEEDTVSNNGNVKADEKLKKIVFVDFDDSSTKVTSQVRDDFDPDHFVEEQGQNKHEHGSHKHKHKRDNPFLKFESPSMDKKYNAIPNMEVLKLPRGGLSIETEAIGRIQYGIPPESIKDSMNLGVSVPTFYIVPVERFCRELGPALGVNLAEFEFPVYFNFFVQQRKCTLIVDSDQAERNIRRVFGETLLGPIQLRREDKIIDCEEDDFDKSFPRKARPSHYQELKHFRTGPDGSEMQLDSLLNFYKFEMIEHTQLNMIGCPSLIDVDNVEDVKEEGFDLDEEEILTNWSFSEVVKIAQVSTIWPADATAEEKFARSRKRVEVFKMPGGEEYIVHDIDENNVIIGKSRFSGHVRVSGNISVDGFAFMKNPSSSDKSKSSRSIIKRNAFDENDLPPSFYPPSFGVTVLGNSHGFDAKGSTSGYVLWVNGRGIMIDPPPYASSTLEREGIRPCMIIGVIITHCHADHDAGTFQKILTGSPTVIITTPTIYRSFIRKYAALSALNPKVLRHSHRYKSCLIGQPLRFQGATFKFTYSLHSIPCVGFRVEWRGKSMYFSGDTFYNPEGIDKLVDKGVMTKERAEDLKNKPLQHADLILHEAGVPPLHTTVACLQSLPQAIRDNLYVVHTAQLPEGCGLKVAPTGTAGTIRLDEEEKILSTEREELVKTHYSAKRLTPLVSLRPLSSTDSWFILNLFSAVPFFTSLSYVTAMEILEAAKVDTFNMNDIVIPAHRRRDVLCIVWEGTCMERESSNSHKVTASVDKRKYIRRVSTTNHPYGAHNPISSKEILANKNRLVAVWYAGDWTGPRCVQPEKRLSGESSNSTTHDIVAMSLQGVKAITVPFNDLHSILKSGSDSYRNYLKRLNSNFTTPDLPPMFHNTVKDFSIIELLETNSTLRKLSAVQKRQIECLAEGPVFYEKGKRLWSSGTVVDRTYLLVAGTAKFLVGRRGARTSSLCTLQKKYASRRELLRLSSISSFQVDDDGQVDYTEERKNVQDNDIVANARKVKEDYEFRDSDSSNSWASSDDFSTPSSSVSGSHHNPYGLSVLVKGFRNRAEEVKDQPIRRGSDSSFGSIENIGSFSSNNSPENIAYGRFANKVLNRLNKRRLYSSGLVFSRGHFLGDISKMAAGDLVDTGADDEAEEDLEYGYGDKNRSFLSNVSTIHEREGDKHIVHSSTLVSGKDGCVVLIFHKNDIGPFLDKYPGILLSLLGTPVVV